LYRYRDRHYIDNLARGDPPSKTSGPAIANYFFGRNAEGKESNEMITR